MSLITTNELLLPKPKYVYIQTEEKARTALSEISNHRIIEVDTETCGLDHFTDKVSLLQIGIPNKAFVFDVRKDTEHSSIGLEIFKPLFTDKNVLKILQNAVFDMGFIKVHGGYYIENIFDTMLVEQLFNLGISNRGADLESLVFKYLGLKMDKEPRGTFTNYYQTFKPYQLEYAAQDVTVLRLIREMQLPQVKREDFENVCRLEFEFTKPMCEMELNGICFDVERYRRILSEVEVRKETHHKNVSKLLSSVADYNTLFDVSLINIDSNLQLKKALLKFGFDLESTDVSQLNKHQGHPVIDELLSYRKAQKFISTYGESLIAHIHKLTGRLHTRFKQMVSTGRMSSSDPNLQNIPKEQIYRSCFIAKPGYRIVTADMSGAELRILGNLSADQIFVESYHHGIDLHTRTASEIFGISMNEVSKNHRNAAKAINFGLAYGLSKFGLARRLKISEVEAEEMIGNYFARYKGIKRFLDTAARDAVLRRYSRTVSGRRRYYTLPDHSHPDFRRAKASVEREGKNAPIQGANADTIKESMILLVKRLQNYDAKLLLTVHDEVVVEAREDQAVEVSRIVAQSLIDGFGRYFNLIPMETEALVGPCWLKGECERPVNGGKCHGKEMKFVEDARYGRKVICSKCGGDI